MNLLEELYKVYRGKDPSLLVVGKVRKRDEDGTYTVSLFDAPDLYGCLINATDSGKSTIRVEPAIGSYVIVACLDHAPVIISTTDVSAVRMKIEATTLEITEDGITIDGGKQRGLVLAEKLIERLNTIEQDLNSLKEGVTKWVPVPQDGGANLKNMLIDWASSMIAQTKVDDVENERIKQ